MPKKPTALHVVEQILQLGEHLVQHRVRVLVALQRLARHRLVGGGQALEVREPFIQLTCLIKITGKMCDPFSKMS